MVSVRYAGNYFCSILRDFRPSHQFSCVNPSLARHYSENKVAVCDKNNQVEYPPIRPKFPPGSWGNMGQREAWLWYNTGNEIYEQPTWETRVQMMRKKCRHWHLPVFTDDANILNYQQYVTKTNILHSMPTLYDRIPVDDVVSDAKAIVLDSLSRDTSQTYLTHRHRDITEQQRKLKLKFDNIRSVIYELMINVLSNYDHLVRCQTDEDIWIQAFWHRHGIKTKMPYVTDEYGCYKHITRIINDSSRFQSDMTSNFCIRTENPLGPMLPLTDEMCHKAFYEPFPYWPSTIGQKSVYQMSGVVPGFEKGNPCEFIHLNVIMEPKPRELYPSEYLDERTIGAGLTCNFISLVAQSLYQGFSWYRDLTRPVCSQTIVTDGEFVRFFVTQLNTLVMWKDDEANSVQNLCWVSDPMRLYETDTNGAISVNDDAVLWICKFLMLEPIERQDVSDTPLPPDTVSPALINEFIKTKEIEVEEEVEETYYDEGS